MTGALAEAVLGIATAGRRDELALTLEVIARQKRLPDRVLVCPATEKDFDQERARSLPFPIEVVRAPRGLCAQRNALLRASKNADLLLLFDDDFYPASDYLVQAVELFEREPDIVVATHHPKLDGARSSPVSHERALAALRALDTRERVHGVRQTYGGYGCNMVLRLAPVRAHDLWFDENLPLYGWLEDIDFTRRLAPYGRIVVDAALAGVHLGVKRGRSSGLRPGYSQIANPLYMLRKGSLSFPYALRQIARNVAKNALRVFWPEPWVDRRGRVRGNARAVADLMVGRLHPLNAAKLP